MVYSEDKKEYTIIIEDNTEFMIDNPDVEEIEDEKYRFVGSLQNFGEVLESCGYRQEDIKEHIEEFVNSGFEPNSGLECWVEPASCYFYLEDNK